MLIRPAHMDDLPAITDIYNDAILKTTASFDLEPKTLDQQRGWFEAHGAKHPIVVAEEDGFIVGWASLSRFSDRCAYEGTVEDSVYVREDCRGKGIGRALLEAIVAEGRRVGVHTIIARIVGGNDCSIHLHEALGFFTVGVMKETGRKFDQWLDVVIMQLLYE
jgi:L-amino acid N-acyltransferase